MGNSSSSCGTADATRYVHESYYSGEEEGFVFICSRMVKGPLQGVKASGVHHFILVSVPSKDYWIIHEWLDEESEHTNSFRYSYGCAKVRGWWCRSLGKFSLDRVLEAAKDASYNCVYKLKGGNCNWWCERVAYFLDSERYPNLDVSWRCICVRDSYTLSYNCHSTHTALTERYVHESHFSGSEVGNVFLCCRNTRGYDGMKVSSDLHHFILVNVPSKDKWVVHELLEETSENTNSYRHSFACERVAGWWCRNIGEYSLDEVLEAANECSTQQSFSANLLGSGVINSSFWCEEVALSLIGRKIKVDNQCPCRLEKERILDKCT